MKKSKDWFEDDQFWDSMAPMLFSEQRIMNAPPEIDGVVAMLDLRERALVLDLCCGIGRHSIEFARRGFKVTGVDLTKAYLDRARKRAEDEGLEIELVQQDMRNFCRSETFDCAVNLFTSFGYFEDPEDDRRVVENLFDSLKPGGTLLIDVLGKEVLAERFQERDWSWLGDEGNLFLAERKLTRNWSWIENRWILLKGTERKEFSISHRLYSAVELITLLSECGFENVTSYGGLSGEPYDHAAERLIVVGKKGKSA
jgi:SAM-dependent methyltransferase